MPLLHLGGRDSGGDPSSQSLSSQDATWIITNSFMIFTMQTGFSLLESGTVSAKNEVNIMVKNVADVVLGGFTYWLFGYGLSFGRGPWTNPFCGVGSFLLLDASGDMIGNVFTNFIFHLSFATTSTTIVSGAVAERFRFSAYCVFSLCNILVYCIPAGWMWAEHGFLYFLGAVDIAGSGAVHLAGGVSALVAANMVGPRTGRYDNGTRCNSLASPMNALLGLFVLWWGWLSFNCGSVYGISNHKWKYVARTGVVTILSSFGGGTVSIVYSYLTRARKYDVPVLINGILSSLVSIAGGCALYHPWEALLIGSWSGLATCLFTPLLDRMRVDDPVGAVSVHAVGGAIGLLAVGLFADPATSGWTRVHLEPGLFKGGSTAFLGVQTLALICIAVWSAIATCIILYVINRFLPLRMTTDEELVGADLLEHNIRRRPQEKIRNGPPPPTTTKRVERSKGCFMFERVRRYCFKTRVVSM